eukprot:6465417-Amphidinium_carterae.2
MDVLLDADVLQWVQLSLAAPSMQRGMRFDVLHWRTCLRLEPCAVPFSPVESPHRASHDPTGLRWPSPPHSPNKCESTLSTCERKPPCDPAELPSHWPEIWRASKCLLLILHERWRKQTASSDSTCRLGIGSSICAWAEVLW